MPPEIIAVREQTLAAHLDGENEVREFLQLFFDSMGPNGHIGEAFHHASGATAVEVLTVFPDGFDGKQTGQVSAVRSVGVFTFDGDKTLAEKLYADVSLLVPFMPWLVDA